MADFKAYAQQDGTDYTLTVSQPSDITSLNDKGRVSIVVDNTTGTAVLGGAQGASNGSNLPAAIRTTDTVLTGGPVIDITLTQAQYNLITPAATLTTSGISYYIASQIELYNTRFFPRQGTDNDYHAYVVIDGTDYTLYFSATQPIIDADNVSIRFETADNIFTNILDITYEVVTADDEGLNDYFNQDGMIVKTSITAAQWTAIMGLFTLEPEVGIHFLTDDDTLETFDTAFIPDNGLEVSVEGLDVAVGDNLFFLRNTGSVEAPILREEVFFAGIISGIDDTNIYFSTEPTSDMVGANSFFIFGKDQGLDSSGVIGFFAEVTFTSDDVQRAELFSINSEAFQSST